MAEVKQGRRRFRPVLRVFFVVLWAGVVFLALEAGVRGWQRWLERGNPYIALQKEHGAPLPPEDLPVSIPLHAEIAAYNRALRIYAPFQRVHDPLNIVAAQQIEDPIASEAVLRSFAVLSAAELQAAAAVYELGLAVVDKGVNYAAAFGEWPIPPLRKLGLSRSLWRAFEYYTHEDYVRPAMDAVYAAKAQGGATKTNVPYWNENFASRENTAIVLPVETGPFAGCYFIFERAYRKYTLEAPIGSRWEIPWFKYRRDYAGTASGIPIYINEHGFRDEPVPLPRPDGVYRIACIGGSTTFEGLSNDRSWPNMAETILNAQLGLLKEFRKTKVDLVNCGVEGVSSVQIRRRLADYLALDPDMLVLCEGINDIMQRFSQYVDLPHMAPWRGWLARSAFLQRFAPGWLLPPEEELRAAFRALTLTNFGVVARAAEARGIRVAICTLPHTEIGALTARERAFLDYDLRSHWNNQRLNLAQFDRLIRILNEELEAFAREHNFLLVPLARHYSAKHLNNLDTFRDMCHLYQWGTEIKALVFSSYFADAFGAPMESLFPERKSDTAEQDGQGGRDEGAKPPEAPEAVAAPSAEASAAEAAPAQEAAASEQSASTH